MSHRRCFRGSDRVLRRHLGPRRVPGLTASSKLNGRPPRRLGLVPEPPLALRGLLDPTTPSAPRPSVFRPEDSISLITSVAYARLDCSRAFPSQPRCRLKASSRQRRLSTSSPNRHLDEREDRQPNPEILWNPQTRANWALSQILAQSQKYQAEAPVSCRPPGFVDCSRRLRVSLCAVIRLSVRKKFLTESVLSV